MTKLNTNTSPKTVLTGVYYVFLAIVEPLMAINGTYLTWFKTTQFFHESVPFAPNLQTDVLDAGSKLAVWQLGYSCVILYTFTPCSSRNSTQSDAVSSGWLMIAMNSALLFHAIPKALPNDLAAQERLITYLLLGLIVGDIASFVSTILVLPTEVLFDITKWSAVVWGNIPLLALLASIVSPFALVFSIARYPPSHAAFESPAMSTQSQNPSNLLQLPHDIILEIFSVLPIPEIASFRQSCQLLHSISNTRSIWAHAFLNLENHITGPKPRLERPIKTYNSLELEALVVKMVQLDKNWTSPNPEPRSIREISRPLSEDSLLLPGGRWLLMVTKGPPTRLVAYDLETPLMEKQVLADLPDVSSDEHDAMPNMSVTVVENSPMLAWDVLIPRGGSPILMKFVRIVTDSECNHLTLEDLCGLGFHQEHMAIPFGAPLFDNLIFTTEGDSGNNDVPVKCAIVDWKASSLTGHYKSVFRLNTLYTPACVQFLSCKRRFFVWYDDFISVYDIPPFEMLPAATEMGEAHSAPLLVPLWACDVDSITDETSTAVPLSIPIQISAQHLRFAIFMGESVFQLLDIPRIDQISPLVAGQMTFRYPWHAGFLGSRRGFQISDLPSEGPENRGNYQVWTCLTYNAKDAFAPKSGKSMEWAISEGSYRPEISDSLPPFIDQFDWQFDESRGRVVIFHANEDDLIQIVDFV
ncbi:hypothetical protein FRB97_009561 [Tulasnella sp. 331]|nr:hypothetical protein FRB97_009561 [Tulasnella sp. 331]